MPEHNGIKSGRICQDPGPGSGRDTPDHAPVPATSGDQADWHWAFVRRCPRRRGDICQCGRGGTGGGTGGGARQRPLRRGPPGGSARHGKARRIRGAPLPDGFLMAMQAPGRGLCIASGSMGAGQEGDGRQDQRKAPHGRPKGAQGGARSRRGGYGHAAPDFPRSRARGPDRPSCRGVGGPCGPLQPHPSSRRPPSTKIRPRPPRIWMPMMSGKAVGSVKTIVSVEASDQSGDRPLPPPPPPPPPPQSQVDIEQSTSGYLHPGMHEGLPAYIVARTARHSCTA